MKAAILLMALVVLAAVTVEGRKDSSKSSPAPAPAKGDERAACMEAVMNNMITCVDYMVVGAGESKPDKACCTGTKTVITGDPKCLCLALAAAPGYGIDINVTRAADLPSFCHISKSPTLSKCLAAAEKGPAPEASAPAPQHQYHHGSAPAPAPKNGSSSASVSYALMALVALIGLVLAF